MKLNLLPFVSGSILICRGASFLSSRPIRRKIALFSSSPSPPNEIGSYADDDDDDNEEVFVSDWRSLRHKLIVSEQKEKSGGGQVDGAKKQPAVVVAPENLAFLRLQNPALAHECETGAAWAHPLPRPEAGSLLVRRPFEVQVLATPGYWRDRVQQAAEETYVKHTQRELERSGNYSYSKQGLAEWRSDFPYMLRLTEFIVKRALDRITAAAAEEPRKTQISKVDTVRLEVCLSVFRCLLLSLGYRKGHFYW